MSPLSSHIQFVGTHFWGAAWGAALVSHDWNYLWVLLLAPVFWIAADILKNRGK